MPPAEPTMASTRARADRRTHRLGGPDVGRVLVIGQPEGHPDASVEQQPQAVTALALTEHVDVGLADVQLRVVGEPLAAPGGQAAERGRLVVHVAQLVMGHRGGRKA